MSKGRLPITACAASIKLVPNDIMMYTGLEKSFIFPTCSLVEDPRHEKSTKLAHIVSLENADRLCFKHMLGAVGGWT